MGQRERDIHNFEDNASMKESHVYKINRMYYILFPAEETRKDDKFAHALKNTHFENSLYSFLH